MGVLHNELPSSTLGRAIRAVLGVKEGEKTIERFGETLTPVLDLWRLPEFSKLRDEWLCTGAGQQSAGGAGFLGEVSLTNPTGSGKLAIVERIILNQGTLATATLRVKVAVATDLGTTQNVVAFRDLRIAVASATIHPVCTITTKNGDATSHGFVCDQQLSLKATGVFFGPYVLPPGTSLICDPAVNNNDIEYAFYWRERRALAGELD